MKILGICAGAYEREWKATFEALGEALGVSFEQRALGDDRDLEGMVVLGADRTIASKLARAARPCFVAFDDRDLPAIGSSSTLTFGLHSELPSVLRGRDITVEDAADAKALPDWLTQVSALATKNGSPVWAIRDDGGCRHHFVALLPPRLKENEPLFAHLSAQRLARLLPLVLFIRSVGEDRTWEPPPLLASFMFDDPNLHWPSYGFVDYADMVTRARAGNYHVSIATIPLDSWFVHPATAAIFKDNVRHISLLYHGNDHVSNELGRSLPADAMQRLLHHAVSRVERLESRTGLDVARVMAPPHGACSETALSEMARVGFEAVCVSRGSLRHHNPRARWTRTIGMRPCDLVAGLPVIPRFGLSQQCRTDILIAALFHQPIVPMTHHAAVADGYGLLDETATFINSLGHVTWGDMASVSRALFARKLEGSTLWARLFTKLVRITAPSGVNWIQIERPWLTDPTEEPLFWRTLDRGAQWCRTPGRDAIAVEPGATVEVVSSAPRALSIDRPVLHKPSLTPVARRFLTEMRDRALPSIQRFAGRSARAD